MCLFMTHIELVKFLHNVSVMGSGVGLKSNPSFRSFGRWKAILIKTPSDSKICIFKPP